MITITRVVPGLGVVAKQTVEYGPIRCEPGQAYPKDIFVIEDGFRVTGIVSVSDGKGYHVIE